MEDYLTDSERSYFSEFEEFFDSPAWRALAEGWRKDLEALPERAFWEAKSWDEILAARALCTKLKEYLSAPQLIAYRKAAMIEERQFIADVNREAERPDV